MWRILGLILFASLDGPGFPLLGFTTECGRFKRTFLNVIVNFEVIPNV